MKHTRLTAGIVGGGTMGADIESIARGKARHEAALTGAMEIIKAQGREQ